MAVIARKYNPGFLSDDELIATFCVRTAEHESLIEALRECSGSANTHQIVIGPRGSGKTSLLLRAAAEVTRDSELAARFFPIIFAEESYEVSTAGEFWLECLSRLAGQVPRPDGGVDLLRTFEELRTIHDDQTLEGRCLGTLQDFADRQGKRLVLIVENLNMMFRDMGNDDAGWRLRKVLQTEPRIVLLASATSQFSQMNNPKEALYQFFRVIRLRPLDTEDCATLWRTVSGQTQAPKTIQALRILTGGSPRLLTIVARFGANLSFRELMADLLDLVDDHTEYFKSHLDALPAQERRVYLALTDLWKPANAREIADRARLGTSKCSAQLARLVERGAVEVSGGSARRKLYYLTERLYNIYYLMRRARGPAPLVDALIRFMEAYYSTDELKEFGARMALEALGSDGDALTLCRLAFERLVGLPSLEAHREELLSLAPPALAYAPDEPSLVFQAPSAAKGFLGRALALAESGRLQEAVVTLDEVIRVIGGSNKPTDLEQDLALAMSLAFKGSMLSSLNRHSEALVSLNEITQRFGESRVPALETLVTNALVGKSVALSALNRHGETLDACDGALERFGKYGSSGPHVGEAIVMVGKGNALFALNRIDEAISVWRAVAERFGRSGSSGIVEQVPLALANIGAALCQSGRLEEALAACDRALERFGDSVLPEVIDVVSRILFNKGIILVTAHRNEEALAVWEEHERRFGTTEGPELSKLVVSALVSKGTTLARLNRHGDAIEVWNDVLRRFGKGDALLHKDEIAMAVLNRLLALSQLDKPEEALEACDEALRWFRSDGDEPCGAEPVARVLVNKGFLLVGLGRTDEGLAVWDEVVRRFETNDAPVLRNAAEVALCGRAQHELAKGRSRTAIELLDRAILPEREGFPKSRLRYHLIRAQAHLAEGDGPTCAADVKTALSILPELNMLPRDVLVDLAGLATGLGLERMCDLIGSSPVRDLLLPLTTALERELGLEPRVAREVEEIAEDIRREVFARPNGTSPPTKT